MTQQYQLNYIATQTTTTVVATGNLTVHTVTCPIALTGTATFQDVAGSPATYFVLPIGSIGSFMLNTSMGNGLKVVTSAADKVITSYTTTT